MEEEKDAGKTDSMEEKSDQDPKVLQGPQVKQDWHEFITFERQDKHRNWHYKCNFCGTAISGSRKRWSEHILTARNKPKNVKTCPLGSSQAKKIASTKKCSKASLAILEEQNEEELEDDTSPGNVDRPSKRTKVLANKVPQKQTVLENFFDSHKAKVIRDNLQKFCVEKAVPFAAMESVFLKAAFLAATDGGYHIPGRDYFGGAGLDDLDEQQEVKKHDHLKHMGQMYKPTIVSDAWENLKNESNVNFLAVFARDQGEPTHLSSVYCGTNEKTAKYMFAEFQDIIDVYFDRDPTKVGVLCQIQFCNAVIDEKD